MLIIKFNPVIIGKVLLDVCVTLSKWSIIDRLIEAKYNLKKTTTKNKNKNKTRDFIKE